jgi:hypothetical protein
MRAYNQLGLGFEEAACAVDLAILVPDIERESPAAAAAIASARDTLTRLGAAPFLARLDGVRSRNGSGPAGGTRATGSSDIDLLAKSSPGVG